MTGALEFLFELGYRAGYAGVPCDWEHLADQDAVVLECGYRCGQVGAAGRRDLLRLLIDAVAAGPDAVSALARELGAVADLGASR